MVPASSRASKRSNDSGPVEAERKFANSDSEIGSSFTSEGVLLMLIIVPSLLRFAKSMFDSLIIDISLYNYDNGDFNLDKKKTY